MSGKLISVVEGRQDIVRAEAVASNMLNSHYSINTLRTDVIPTIFAAFCEILKERGYVKMDVLKLKKDLTEGILISLFNEEELHECNTKGRCSPDRIKLVFEPEQRIEVHHNEDLFEAITFQTQSKLKLKYEINILKLTDISAIVTTFIRALFDNDFNEALIALDVEDRIQIAMVDTERLMLDGDGSLLGADVIELSTAKSDLYDTSIEI